MKLNVLLTACIILYTQVFAEKVHRKSNSKRNKRLFENSKIEIKNGYVTRPETYGLGVKFNEEILKKFSYKEKVNTMISTEEADIQLI